MRPVPNNEHFTGSSRASNATGLGVVVAGFVLSRVYFLWLGVRFETSSLQWYWQVLDPRLLADRLLESVYFLHAQPPLFNLVLGIGLKLAPEHAALLFQLGFLALGLAMAGVLHVLLTRFGVPPLVAAVLVLLYATSPNWLMYESWLFYDFPNAVALVVAGGALVAAGRQGSSRWLAVFFVVLAVVVFTRSLFHLAWFLACLALVAVAWPRRWRAVAAAAAIPLMMILMLYAKNQAVFGFFGSSSWLGMSLTKLTTGALEPAERGRWAREGWLSPVATVPPFSPLAAYEAAGVAVTDCGIPALGWRTRSTGAPNFNHLAYLEISRVSLRDALVVLRARPGLYLRSVARACGRFFWSPVNYPPFESNLLATASTYRMYESTVNRPPAVASLGLLAIAYGAVRGWRWLRGRGSDDGAFFAWAALTMAWVFCVGSLLELGENFRFRFVLEPLAFVLLGALLGDLLSGRSRRRPDSKERRGSHEGPAGQP